jgi:L-threonylcarbamoyladenylate synthase
MEDLNASREEITRLKTLLVGGGIAAIPTETFYGLAADPKSREGVERILVAKGRAGRNPLPVVFANRTDLAALGVAATEEKLARWFGLWPSPLTVVLPLDEPIAASLDRPSLAVRLPASPPLLCLLDAIGPVTATSANRSGEPPLADPDEVARLFEGTVDLLVDGGKTTGENPSTLIDATVEPPVLLRPGAFPWPPR